MKIRIFIVLLLQLMLFYYCSNSGAGKDATGDTKAIIDDAVAAAEKFAAGFLEDYERITTPVGNILLRDNERGFLIEKSGIKIGYINGDNEQDAILTMQHMRGDYIVGSEHLVFLTSGGKPILVKSVESDMRILSIENGIITAKVPTHPRSSPLFNCESCQEIIKYRFTGDTLVRVE